MTVSFQSLISAIDTAFQGTNQKDDQLALIQQRINHLNSVPSLSASDEELLENQKKHVSHLKETMTHQMVVINQFSSPCAERLSIGQNIVFITKFALLNIKTQKVHDLCQRVLLKISSLLQKRQNI